MAQQRGRSALVEQHAADRATGATAVFQPVVYMDCATSAARPERRDNAVCVRVAKPPKATPHNATER